MTPPTEINGELVEGGGEYGRRFRLPERWYRDVWLIVITAVMLFALINFENEQEKGVQEREDLEATTAQLCEVVVNVHKGNVIQLQTAQNRLTQTRNYLNTLAPDEIGTSLAKRVRANLPSVVADVKVAKKQEVATRVPNECVEPPSSSNPSK